jgi:hypothetical protein
MEVCLINFNKGEEGFRWLINLIGNKSTSLKDKDKEYIQSVNCVKPVSDLPIG